MRFIQGDDTADVITGLLEEETETYVKQGARYISRNARARKVDNGKCTAASRPGRAGLKSSPRIPLLSTPGCARSLCRKHVKCFSLIFNHEAFQSIQALLEGCK